MAIRGETTSSSSARSHSRSISSTIGNGAEKLCLRSEANTPATRPGLTVALSRYSECASAAKKTILAHIGGNARPVGELSRLRLRQGAHAKSRAVGEICYQCPCPPCRDTGECARERSKAAESSSWYPRPLYRAVLVSHCADLRSVLRSCRRGRLSSRRWRFLTTGRYTGVWSARACPGNRSVQQAVLLGMGTQSVLRPASTLVDKDEQAPVILAGLLLLAGGRMGLLATGLAISARSCSGSATISSVQPSSASSPFRFPLPPTPACGNLITSIGLVRQRIPSP